MNKFQKSTEPGLYRYNSTGEYVYRYSVGHSSKYCYLNTSVLTVAKFRLAAKRAELAKLRVGDATTMGQLAAAWDLQVDNSPHLKPKSRVYWHQRSKYLLVSWPELANLKPRDITPEMCLEWAARYSRENCSTAYNNSLAVLRKLFAMAMGSGLVASNPAADIRRKRDLPRVPEIPNPEDFREILQFMRRNGGSKSMELADFAEFLATTGLRAQSEAAWVEWDDVDFQRGTLTVRGAPGLGTKSGGHRTIPLIPEALRLLERRKQACDRLDKAVFLVRNCGSQLARACAELGKPHLRQHDLRHLFASSALSSGVDVLTVSQWLGHQDKGMTLLRTYAHLLNHHSQAMAQKVRVGPETTAPPDSPASPVQPCISASG